MRSIGILQELPVRPEPGDHRACGQDARDIGRDLWAGSEFPLHGQGGGRQRAEPVVREPGRPLEARPQARYGRAVRDDPRCHEGVQAVYWTDSLDSSPHPGVEGHAGGLADPQAAPVLGRRVHAIIRCQGRVRQVAAAGSPQRACRDDELVRRDADGPSSRRATGLDRHSGQRPREECPLPRGAQR